jgi:GAF domain-containing protein
MVSNRDQFYLRFFEHYTGIDDYYETQLKAFSDKLRDSQASLIGANGFRSADLARSELLNNAMKVVYEALNAQICAVFLMNKQGALSRQGFYGIDKHGASINPDWYPEEEYDVNQGTFVGRAAIVGSSDSSPFGNIQHTVSFQGEGTVADQKSVIKYLEICQSLDRVIAVPINDRTRTFGVLRILNTIDPVSGRVVESKGPYTSNRDIMMLTIFASHISNAILALEQSYNRRLLSFITTKTVESTPHDSPEPHSSNAGFGAENVLRESAKMLVQNESLPFVFAIIRIMTLDGKLQEKMVEFHEPDYSEQHLRERNCNSIDSELGDTFVSIACQTKMPVIISSISERLPQFNNESWVRRLGLTTFCCFPLLCKDKLLGTMSLYTKCKFTYDAKSVEYLQTISDALALYLYVNKGIAKKPGHSKSVPVMHQSTKKENSIERGIKKIA